jgi:6-phosphofructokinase 2
MVVTVTLSPTMDYTVEVDELVPNRKLRADVSGFHPGGGGVNVACVLHDLGMDPAAVVAVGGVGGRVVVDGLEQRGIATVAVHTRSHTRWSEIVRDRGAHNEYRLVGSPVPLSAAEVEECLTAALAHACEGRRGAVVLSGSAPPGVTPDHLASLAVGCRSAGLRLVVDTSGPALVAAMDAGVDLLKPSWRELGELVRLAGLGTDGDLAASCRAVREHGARSVVVSLGAAGAVAVADDVEVELVPPPIQIVSTVGAGDALVAGIVAAQARGDDLAEAARFGVALATATCLTSAGDPARAEDVQRILGGVSVQPLQAPAGGRRPD